MARQQRSVTLLPSETLLKQLLLECRDYLSSEHNHKLEIRFAGGWVRDKLLGIRSLDIDVALSSMSGMQFGEALRAFYVSNEAKFKLEAQIRQIPGGFNGPFKIGRKSEKSKNLETAIINIFGLDVDLVNLRRKSADGQDSQTEFGTPEEDALLRDATINALFYNLDKDEVEDFTGKGFYDMAAGIMRTPLDPYQTFMDDPLRVLRMIRFASKLGYTIDDATEKSMRDERVHTALNTKINRQRIGSEAIKLMKGRNPLTSFQLIHGMGLYPTIFLGSAWDVRRALFNAFPKCQLRAYKLLATLLKDDSILGQELAQSEENCENLWTLAAYAPMAGLRSNPREAARCMMEAIKTTAHISKVLEKALQNMDDIVLTVNRTTQECYTGNLPLSTAGVAIRSWGQTWRLQVLYSLLAEVAYEESEDCCAQHLDRYSKFMEFVVEQELQDAPVRKQIITAGEIKEFFELQKSGDFMKGTIDGVLRWQFANKNGSRDDALEWLKMRKDFFGIPGVGYSRDDGS
ncbi:hypothetical protein FQN54_008922 [Arachnomyces sp. PD_36]|nr:hypothetical protein FQN54_008922 [Arachnomyces sp. PD_36]